MRSSFLLFFALLVQPLLKAENAITNVIVETYYISDNNDATDTIGGGLEAGSKTYRVYIQMLPGYKLKKIFGIKGHPLKIKSSAVFFNNKSRDKFHFGYQFTPYSLKENTVALDTWLTIGQTTPIGPKTYFGVLKSQDRDGSIIGGKNNDGGSAEMAGGLLVNSDPLAGIPLTTSDGMDTMKALPTNWNSSGFNDKVTNVDSSIFGTAKASLSFESEDVFLQNSSFYI